MLQLTAVCFVFFHSSHFQNNDSILADVLYVLSFWLIKVVFPVFLHPSSICSSVPWTPALPLTRQHGCHEEITAGCCCCCVRGVCWIQISQTEVSRVRGDLATQQKVRYSGKGRVNRFISHTQWLIPLSGLPTFSFLMSFSLQGNYACFQRGACQTLELSVFEAYR